MSVSMAISFSAVPADGKMFRKDGRLRQCIKVRLFFEAFGIHVVFLHRIHAQIFLLHLRQVIPVEIRDGQFTEDIIDDRGRHFDSIVQFHGTVRLEPGKDKRLNEFFQRHAVLKSKRDGDRKTIHEASERRPFLVHVQKDFSDRPILIFTGAQVQLMSPDNGLLRVSASSTRERAALGEIPNEHPFGDFLRHPHHAGGRLHGLSTVRRGAQRLTQLGPVTIQRDRFDHALPGKQIGRLDVFERGIGRHVDGLADRAADERLCRGHHADMRIDGDGALPDSTASIGTIEHRKVFGLQMRRAFHRHRPAAVIVRGSDLFLRKAKRLQHVEVRFIQLGFGQAELFDAERLSRA